MSSGRLQSQCAAAFALAKMWAKGCWARYSLLGLAEGLRAEARNHRFISACRMFVLSRSPALVLSVSSPLPLLNSLLGCSSIPRLLGIVQAVSVASPLTSPLPTPMASFMQSLPVCSASRKQSTAVPFYLHKASQSRVSSGTRSSFSSLCSSARLTPSRMSRPFPSVPPTAYPIGIVSVAVPGQQMPEGYQKGSVELFLTCS